MRRLLILAVGLALVAAACSGSDEAEVATLEDTTPQIDQSVSEASDTVDDEQALLAFAACMRENGVETFPDPRLSADGSVSFGTGGGSTPFGDVDNDTAEAAVNACIGELEGAAFAPGGSAFDMTEMQDSMVEFAQCMRDNGIDFDDPNLSGMFSGGEIQNPFEELDIDDPEIAAAVEKCQGVFIGVGPGFGG